MSKITGTITSTVTIGSGGFKSPLTITSTGVISPQNVYGAVGLYLNHSGVATIVNNGSIAGSNGCFLDFGTYNGGDGVSLLSAASLSNAGSITGGTAGGYYYGELGGSGIDAASANVSIGNTGFIEGGTGGRTGNYGAGAGGTGVFLQAQDTLTNAGNGLIFGGYGGIAYERIDPLNGGGGFGVIGSAGSTISNLGDIAGGKGGHSGYAPAGTGGAGVAIYGASTLTNAGFVDGGGGGVGQFNSDYGGPGGFGVILKSGAGVTNNGYIGGGYGGATEAGSEPAGIGGTAVYAYEATVTNLITIQGGAGGFAPSGVGGVGGDGAVIIGAHATINNQGHIYGGSGGYGRLAGAAGGTGVFVDGSGAYGENSGMITGGPGANTYYYSSFAGAGGIGVIANSGAVFRNTGTILGGVGGAGGAHSYFEGAMGGAGADVIASSFFNSGVIRAGSTDGYINGSASGVIISNGGSLMNTGSIFGAPTDRSEYPGIGGSGVVASFSTVTNNGTITGGYGTSPNFFGFGGTGGDGAVVSYGVFINNNLLLGGAGGTGSQGNGFGGTGITMYGGTLINAGTITPGVGADAVFVEGITGKVIVDPGAKFNGLVVAEAGGAKGLEVAGTSTKALSGVGTSFTGFTDISFATGAAWTIQGNGAGLTSGQEIYGFTAGDTIDVSSLHFNAKDKVTVATAGTVSITQGATVTKIDIVGATKGESDFHVSKDKTGGTDLTRGTQPKMTFLGSTISNAGAVPMDKTLPPLEHAGGWMSVGNQGRDHTSVGIDLRPYGAVPAVMAPSVPFDGLFVPVTVQAG